MGRIYNNVSELIGNTPLVELKHIEEEYDLNCRLLAKLEYFNPAGSAKDRVAKEMIEQAERDGTLKPGETIIEPTSGNTGIGLASIAAIKGYPCIIVIPDTMSAERINLMKAYGAKVVLSDGTLGMKGSIEKAKEIQKEIPGSVIPAQFENPANSDAHRKGTGPELWRDTNGNIDIFVAGVGTGGTITGVGEYLKTMNPAIEIIGVEPASSPYLSKGYGGAHGIQGIGAGFVPEVLNTKIYDEIIAIEDGDAIQYGKLVGNEEGFLVGISSGAALAAAIAIAKRPESKNKTIVVLFPDGGDRYYSTKLFTD